MCDIPGPPDSSLEGPGAASIAHPVKINLFTRHGTLGTRARNRQSGKAGVCPGDSCRDRPGVRRVRAPKTQMWAGRVRIRAPKRAQSGHGSRTRVGKVDRIGPSLSLIVVLLSGSVPAMAGNRILSESCRNLRGSYEVQFHGQVFPFTSQTYTLRLQFNSLRKGFRYSTNFTWPPIFQAIYHDGMTNVVVQNFFSSRADVLDCRADPDSCLQVARQNLYIFSVARSRLTDSSTGDGAKVAAECAMARIHAFTDRILIETGRTRMAVPSGP